MVSVKKKELTSSQTPYQSDEMCELPQGNTTVFTATIAENTQRNFEAKHKNRVLSIKISLDTTHDTSANLKSKDADTPQLSKLIFADKQICLFMSAMENAEDKMMYITLDAEKSLSARTQARACR